MIDNDTVNGMRFLAAWRYSKNAIAEIFGVSFYTAQWCLKPHWREPHRLRYLREVAAYVRMHPGCTVYDVALECHMSEDMAASLMAQLYLKHEELRDE